MRHLVDHEVVGGRVCGGVGGGVLREAVVVHGAGGVVAGTERIGGRIGRPIQKGLAALAGAVRRRLHARVHLRSVAAVGVARAAAAVVVVEKEQVAVAEWRRGWQQRVVVVVAVDAEREAPDVVVASGARVARVVQVLLLGEHALWTRACAAVACKNELNRNIYKMSKAASI